MCDKGTTGRNKINKKRRRLREIAKAVVCEIETHELHAAATASPAGTSHKDAVGSKASPTGQRERHNNEVSVQEEEDRGHLDRDIIEQEQDQERSVESAKEENESANDSSESAEEENERTEYEELREWSIQCNVPHKALDKLLVILGKRLLPNLPKSAKTFLKTDSCPYLINETEHGQFVYFGIKQGLKSCIVKRLHPENNISLQFNVDGMPIFKSSTKQLWPILCRVHCPQLDIYTPFIVACYCGDAKPHDLVDYFRDFIEEINKLQRDGIIINMKTYEVSVKCFICDSPARALLKSVKGHGGFSACERCTVPGERVKKKRGFCTIYPQVDKRRRTDESFRHQDDAGHHNGISPLLDIDPPIDMVLCFLLDKLHLFDGGAMKKLLEYWNGGDLKIRLGRRSKLELDRRMSCLKNQIPIEFQRKPRSFLSLAKWKCTEFRLFLLYIGPIVLKNILPSVLYEHFLLLHVAARILCAEDLALKYNNHAKIYLETFVLASQRLYGAHSLSLNTHNLIHVADDAKNMGCSLSCVSAYPFESMLGKLKKCIRTAHLPLPQLCRRLYEAQLIETKRPIISKDIQIMKTKVDENESEQAIKLRYKSIILTNKAPDNVVLLKDLTIVQIHKMIILTKNPDSVRIVGREWKKNNFLYKYPSDSKYVRVWELRSRPSTIIGTCPLDTIVAKMMTLSLSLQPGGLKKVYALSLLHNTQ